MRFVPIARIAAITGIRSSAISELVYATEGGWKAQRDVVQAEVNEAVKQSLLVQLKRVSKQNLELIEAGLVAFSEQCKKYGAAPDLEETDMLVKIFERLNRAKSIEEDTADAAKEMGGLLPVEIMAAFANDPYMGQALIEAKIDGPAAPAEETLALPEIEDYEQSRFDSDNKRHING